MTFKELHELELKGEKVFTVLNQLAAHFARQKNIEISIKKYLSFYAAGKPCFIVKQRGLFGKKLWYLRNVINNPRQPSPMFIRVYDKNHLREVLDLFIKFQPKIEEAQGVKVTYHTEDEV